MLNLFNVLATATFQSFNSLVGMINGIQCIRYEGTITTAISGRLTLGTSGNTLTRKEGSYIQITKLY